VFRAELNAPARAILHTFDGGKTWHDQSLNAPTKQLDLEGLSFVSKKKG